MEYLKQAEQYTESLGDWEWFCQHYTRYREFWNVRESVELALWALYNGDCPLLQKCHN